MDSWLVGAAAAAVYFAKYWQNHRRNRTNFPDLRTRLAKTENGPFCGLAPIKELREDVSSNPTKVSGSKVSDSYTLNMFSDSEMVGSSGHRIDHDSVQSSSVSGFSKNQNLRQEDQCRKGPRMDSFNDLLRNRYSYGHLHNKPLSSLDSCLMAQLYMQHVKMEEYIFTSHHSPPTGISRPLFVTDESQIISRASGSFSSESNRTVESKLHNQTTFEKSGYVFGIPPLPKVKSSGLSQKSKRMDTKTQLHSQQGPDDGAILFCLGISIGIISSYVGNQREVSKLRGLLKHTEDVAQDLRDELEMKASLTVKEITNEKYESRETYDDSFRDKATNYGRESYYDKVEESSESMSQIEAELEAELERLGRNMNVANPERRLSDLVELDPDFVADFAEGELRSDKVNAQALTESLSNEDRRGTSTTHSGNYAVSPRELSLRLHEVIQSKLKKRIEELEKALQHSERKVKLMESEHKNSWKISKYNEEFDFPSDRLVLELSGEALVAYNEAHEELSKTDELEEEEEDNSRPDMYQSNNQDELRKYDQSRNIVKFPDLTQYSKNTAEEGVYDQGRTSEDAHELADVTEDECSDSDDEMEKQLIEKIVKKTKEGSHGLLNAQRILSSLDEI